jgi:hypothetical protein
MFITQGMIATMTLLSRRRSLSRCRILILAAPTLTVIAMEKLLIRIQKLQNQSIRRVLTACHQFRATVRFAT